MPELNDLSGEFNPDLKYEDFSKDFLVRIMRQWQSAYLRLDEIWVGNVGKLHSAEETLSLDIAAWHRVAEQTLPRVAKAANIEVKHIVDILKVLQVTPDNNVLGAYQPEYEIINPDHIRMHLHRCLTLEWLEKNRPERIVSVCHVLETSVIEKYFQVFFPDAKIRSLKLPPRKSPDESPACIWEMWRG